MKKQSKEIQATKLLIKSIKKDFGDEYTKCSSYVPSCPSCQMRIFLGHLEDYLEELKFQITK